MNYYASYINLSHRKDRREHMEKQLARVGMDAIRTSGMLPHEFQESKYDVMRNRTPGAIGCHMSQVSVMHRALEFGRHAIIMEDDISFCDDFNERMAIIEDFLRDINMDFDVFWLGSSFHVNPPYWHKIGKSGMPPDCSAQLGYDAKLTSHPRIIQTFGAFATFAYIVNVNSIQKILNLFDNHIHESIGIDWLFIKLQPQLKTFAFLPGCVRQIDNKSDIGNGMTMWSGFLKLNGTLENSSYVYQDRMEMFQPDQFNWAEASQNKFICK
jgi:GR25 family glycosyltransferase involved in LPS biosynthesis